MKKGFMIILMLCMVLLCSCTDVSERSVQTYESEEIISIQESESMSEISEDSTTADTEAPVGGAHEGDELYSPYITAVDTIVSIEGTFSENYYPYMDGYIILLEGKWKNDRPALLHYLAKAMGLTRKDIREYFSELGYDELPNSVYTGLMADSFEKSMQLLKSDYAFYNSGKLYTIYDIYEMHQKSEIPDELKEYMSTKDFTKVLYNIKKYIDKADPNRERYADISEFVNDRLFNGNEDLYNDVLTAWTELIKTIESNDFSFRPENSEREAEWRTNLTYALLTGDGTGMERAIYVTPGVYDCYNGMVISDWSVRKDTVNIYDSDREVTILDITVASSNSSTLTEGKHSLILRDEGMFKVFTPIERYERVLNPELSSAEDYVNSVFYKSTQFGICSFIVDRLDRLAGNYEPRTLEEIEEYAKVCLDLDPSTLDVNKRLMAVDGGYTRIGRGTTARETEFIGEEKRGDTTVVTVRFWADHSRTVEAYVVEYHIEPTPIDWKLIDTITISDSGFEAASAST